MKPLIAKLTRPRLTGVVERRRLLDQLDRIGKTKIAWISAPAGSGKTTLVANWLDARKMPCLWYQADEGDADIATFFSYLGIAAKHAAPRYRTPLPLLTREYLSGVATFTKHFFETLFSRMKPPYCFVIDNYQDVPAESRFHEVVRDGLGTVPDGVTVIIISRSDPPPMMSRLQMNRHLDIISAEEMGFTFEESRTLITSQAREKPHDDVIKAMFQKTVGWAAGLMLLTRSSVLEGDLAGQADVPVEQLYDYFATEVYERTDDEMRTLLLMTVFLPRVTIRAADAITGKNNSEQILSRLSSANFFTERHATADFVSYQYHPLFRDFLLKRAWDRFSRDEINGIRKKAAAILEADGQTEDAARLLIEAGEWQGLSNLVLRHAAGLLTAGRFRTLETWMDYIPEKITEHNAWLLYWKASCHITARPVEARSMFERAYALSLDSHDPTGSFLSWTGVVNTFMYEWRDFHPLDQWIAAFAELLKYEGFPSPEVEERATSAIFAAMMFRQPQHPELPVWTKRVQAVMQSTADPSRRMFIGNSLILYLLWTGRISEAGVLVSTLSPVIKSAQVAPLPKLMCLRSMALYHFYASQPELGLRTVEQGLRLAEETDVHQTDLMLYGVAIYHAALLGDAVMAQSYLGRMASVRGQRGGYADLYRASQSSLVALLRGDHDTAAVQAEISVRLADEAGVPLIQNAIESSLVFVLTEARQYDKIGPYISELRKRAEATRSAHIEAWCSSCEAQLALQDGNDALFAERFKRAIDVSKKTGLRLLTVPPAAFSRICAKALELNLETDFVKELITLNKLIPDSSAAVADSWPFPLKVYTLGRYALLRDGKPVVFSGKVQQKPLAMLKALIAFGGKNVSEAQLIDALWPEAEGDAANRNLDTTLHRLRKLLGDDEAILLQEGQMSLNNARVWTDAWGFERLLCRVEDMWKHQQQGHKSAAMQDPACPDPAFSRPQPDLEETIRLTEKALALYKGHFLPGDAKEPWTISLRERLRAKFLYYTKALGKHWQQSGRYDLAVECYQNGIGIDDLAEELYQQLMVCHHQLGQEAEVVKIYYRCRAMLQKAFGLEPSTKTREIYSSIRRNG